MIQLSGFYYDGRTSNAIETELKIYADRTVKLGCVDDIFHVNDLEIATRVGNTARTIRFSNGGLFETRDNDRVDDITKKFKQHKLGHWLHQFESRTRFVVIAVALTVLIAVWGMFHGIPLAAKRVAFSLPPETNQWIAKDTLRILDKLYLSPSKLSPQRQGELRKRFRRIVRPLPGKMRYKLIFRSSKIIGPNALALPNGTVIVTDELVRLVKNDNELVAVLAHEVGHIQQRHGLRSVIQGSALVLLTVIITGDVTTSSALVAAIPTLLVETKYSREFEREADRYAIAYLKKQGIPLKHFKNLMRRLKKVSGGAAKKMGFLSTHPPTKERIALTKSEEARSAN